jgi:hypothetical protein
MTTLELRRDWIIHGQPDPYGIDQRLAAKKEARLNGRTIVSTHTRRAGR